MTVENWTKVDESAGRGVTPGASASGTADVGSAGTAGAGGPGGDVAAGGDVAGPGGDDAAVAAVREFNRFYTNVIGLLRGKYLDTPYSLTESRLLFELGQREASEVTDLRRVVDIDPGYLSRILARFESDGLVARERSATDGRRQVIRLTGPGREAIAGLNTRSAEQTRGLLAGPREDHRRPPRAAVRGGTATRRGAPPT